MSTSEHPDDAETPGERDARIRDLSRERATPERVRRSDEIESVRTDRAANLEDRRSERAQQLAVDAALRNERVDTRLESHEARLNAINGSINRAAERSQELATAVEKLNRSVERAATLAEAQRDETRKANEKQISTRQFTLGVVAIIVAIVIPLISSGHL